MDAREEILTRLRAKKRDDTHPPTWRSRRHFDDLAAQFTTALEAAKGEVIRAHSFDEALERLDELVTELGSERVVVNPEQRLAQVAWAERWPAIDWHIVRQTEGELRAFCAAADVGVSGATVALAETGSVLVTSGPKQSRLATLVPPVHVALVPVSALTADIFTWVAARERDERPPASMTFVSGPSKSADIEQTLAVGVHGPKRFVVVLYDD